MFTSRKHHKKLISIEEMRNVYFMLNVFAYSKVQNWLSEGVISNRKYKYINRQVFALSFMKDLFFLKVPDLAKPTIENNRAQSWKSLKKGSFSKKRTWEGTLGSFSLKIVLTWWFSVGICKYKLGYKPHDLL